MADGAQHAANKLNEKTSEFATGAAKKSQQAGKAVHKKAGGLKKSLEKLFGLDWYGVNPASFLFIFSQSL